MVRRGPLVRRLLEGDDLDLVEALGASRPKRLAQAASRLLLNLHEVAGTPLKGSRGPAEASTAAWSGLWRGTMCYARGGETHSALRRKQTGGAARDVGGRLVLALEDSPLQLELAALQAEPPTWRRSTVGLLLGLWRPAPRRPRSTGAPSAIWRRATSTAPWRQRLNAMRLWSHGARCTI